MDTAHMAKRSWKEKIMYRMQNQITAEVYKDRMVGKRYRHFKGGI